MTSDTMNAIRNRKNRTFAIPAAAPARPVKPKIAAMIATMKNPIAQLSMTASNGWKGQPEACNPRAAQSAAACQWKASSNGVDAGGASGAAGASSVAETPGMG